jgi:hypothetical protein
LLKTRDLIKVPCMEVLRSIHKLLVATHLVRLTTSHPLWLMFSA